jgi:putative phosphoesterase
MTIRLGVISDTHLVEITDKFKRIVESRLAGTDAILHAGDMVSPEVLDFFKDYKFYGVQGNMDFKELRGILPRTRVIHVGEWKLGLIHGWGSPEGLEKRIMSEIHDVDIIVYGHSHIPATHFVGEIFFFNPGTACGYSVTGSNTVGILELGEEIKGKIIEV